LQTFCPTWPQTVILLISASQVARIIGVSPTWHGAPKVVSFIYYYYIIVVLGYIVTFTKVLTMCHS
jgi:hypothetical protein